MHLESPRILTIVVLNLYPEEHTALRHRYCYDAKSSYNGNQDHAYSLTGRCKLVPLQADHLNYENIEISTV